jgi:hypothetical protein
MTHARDVGWLNNTHEFGRQCFLNALRNGEDMSIQYEDRFGNCMSAMSQAICMGLPEICEYLLRSGVADPNKPCFVSAFGRRQWRPLEHAAGLEIDTKCIPVLLRYGADPDLADLAHAKLHERALINSFRQYRDTLCATLWVLRNIPGNIWVDMAEPVMDRMKKLDF